MFDYVKVSLSKLPISDEEKKQLPKDGSGFQTKEFECIMTEVRITDEGELEIDMFEYERVKLDKPNLLGLSHGLGHKNERTEKLDFTGQFDFYTYNKRDEWVQFVATFTNGRLISIIKSDRDTAY